MALTAKNRLFIDKYFEHDLNGTQAAITAGYSERSAYAIASELLRKPEISSEIQKRLAEHTMSANEVLYHLTNLARADITEVLDDNGVLDLKKAKAAKKTGIIKRIKQKSITTEQSDIWETETESYDRLRALELLAKYHDLINRVKIEDWRTQAIADIKAGRIEYDVLAASFDADLATELFTLAGVPITQEA